MNINRINTVLACFLLIFCFTNAYSADSFFKLSARSSHENQENGLLLEANSATTQNVDLNSQLTLEVQLFANSQPVSAANIDWTINQTITSETRQTAYFVNNSSQFSTQQTQSTDNSGLSQVLINTGEITSIFQVRATASVIVTGGEPITLTQTFTINTGVQASIKTNTPEQQVAVALDNLCPQLEANKSQLTSQQQALLDRCNAIQQAISEGKTVEVSNALRQMSPEEVAVQADVGANFSRQQFSNIASRLNAVRRGVTGFSFNGLGFSYKEKNIPLNLMLNSLFAVNQDDSPKSQRETGALLNNRVGVFANGNASIGSRSSTSKEDGFDFDNYGISMGADYRLNATRFVGAALGISKSEVLIANNSGDMKTTGYSLNVYINQYFAKSWYVDGVLNIGKNRFDMKRYINFDLSGNAVNRTAISNTSGFQKGLSVSSGYEMHDGALSATFFGRFNYSKLDINKFTETGAQELDLTINSQSVDSAISSFGAQFQYVHSSRRGVFIPFFEFSWVHEYSGAADTISGAFANDGFNSAFNIKTEKADSNYFSNVQGITAVLPRGISAFLKMENIMGRDYYKITNISLGGRMELQF